MTDKIKLNYPQMEEMAQHLKTVQQRLLQTTRLARSAAQIGRASCRERV